MDSWNNDTCPTSTGWSLSQQTKIYDLLTHWRRKQSLSARLTGWPAPMCFLHRPIGRPVLPSLDSKWQGPLLPSTLCRLRRQPALQYSPSGWGRQPGFHSVFGILRRHPVFQWLTGWSVPTPVAHREATTPENSMTANCPWKCQDAWASCKNLH